MYMHQADDIESHVKSFDAKEISVGLLQIPFS